MSFYPAFFRLGGEARRQFEFLTQDDPQFRRTVEDCARMWREKLRKDYPGPLLCRQLFLARSLAVIGKGCEGMGFAAEAAAAAALCVCDHVEQRVFELDQEENDGF